MRTGIEVLLKQMMPLLFLSSARFFGYRRRMLARWWFGFLPGLLCLSFAGEEKLPGSFERLLLEAVASEEWKEAGAASRKMMVLREVALEQDTVSDPVSDRYLITALGGPIDLVHFLALAARVASGEKGRAEALHQQWELEGGMDFEAGRSRTFPPEAHPDDLPSNALGALFGEGIATRNRDPTLDLPAALRTFFKRLEPVPDAVSKRFSHRTLVMGLKPDSSRELVMRRSEWFTAVPIFTLFAYDAARAAKLGNARAALREAGLEVKEYKGRPILIEEIP